MEDFYGGFWAGLISGAFIFGLIGGAIWDSNTISYETAISTTWERNEVYYKAAPVYKKDVVAVK